MHIATIDAGTTNTRVRIWQDSFFISESISAVGVRDTAIHGNNAKLTAAIKNTLSDALSRANLPLDSVKLILATGMLTSNVGLLEIPHIAAPADMEKLAYHMIERTIPEICTQPIWFIPGIKNGDRARTQEQSKEMDIMRGEEVEVFGLVSQMQIIGPAVFILPGSHNKFVMYNQAAQITGCMTTLAGELLQVLSNNTILADAVAHGFATELDAEAFMEGVKCYQKFGLGRAAFTVRIRNQFAGFTPDQARSYLLGIILADDAQALLHSPLFQGHAQLPVIIAGKPAIQQGFHLLLIEKFSQITLVDPAIQANLSAYGAIAIAKKRGLLL